MKNAEHLQRAGNAAPPARGLDQRHMTTALRPPDVCERTREIPGKMRCLFEATEVLSSRIALLTERLNSVLISEPSAETKGVVPPVGTHLGSQLAEVFTRIDLMIGAVERIDALLEL